MLAPLDGPSLQTTITVDSSTVQEIKVGGTALLERKVITLIPEQKVYLYFGGDAGVPSSVTVAADGIVLFRNQLITIEATDSQLVYILAVSTTADVKVAERA
jgi:hypothetical protein